MLFFNYIVWDPSPSLINWNIPFLNRPVLWYGLFFALGFLLAYYVFQSLLKEFLHRYRISKKNIIRIAESISFFVVIGTILGARLGDVIFYQGIFAYKDDVLGILRFWEGGLSSHGGIIGILISLWIFSIKYRKEYPMLNWVVLLDLLSIPALLAGACIRVGNFFNQEILGTGTKLPWGVLFGHPSDGSPLIPRHPVQLYEAFFYFAFFLILWFLRKNIHKMYRIGNTSGLFFLGSFLFRFCIEFVKSPQGILLSENTFLSMGQLLSIPMIFLGAILFFCDQSRLRTGAIKRN